MQFRPSTIKEEISEPDVSVKSHANIDEDKSNASISS
jgi:hypothetical protein